MLPVWLVTIAAVKCIHELAHALACKHFGARCHEMGLLLLGFIPTLYCDASDAWRLPSKWARIGVSSAGMIAELLLASAALVAWWNLEPGLLQTAMLSVVVTCTVGTLVVNANPLFALRRLLHPERPGRRAEPGVTLEGIHREPVQRLAHRPARARGPVGAALEALLVGALRRGFDGLPDAGAVGHLRAAPARGKALPLGEHRSHVGGGVGRRVFGPRWVACAKGRPYPALRPPSAEGQGGPRRCAAGRGGWPR